MTADELPVAQWIETLFTSNDVYRFARWGRPIAPVVFGIEDESLDPLKDGIAQTVAITGGVLAETDPEPGANFMWFFCRNWGEIAQVPHLDKLIPDLPKLLKRLQTARANTYRSFSFHDDGTIQLCVVLLRMDKQLAKKPIQTLATSETLQSLLVWGTEAFTKESPLAVLKENGICIVKPAYAAVVRAGYDPLMPGATGDNSHVLRLAVRVAALLGEETDE